MDKQYWKLWTHDWRSPIQGGNPVWDGTLPHTLPTVDLDVSGRECGAGWNYVRDIETGWRIAGMWPTGRPARITLMEPDGSHIERMDKCRAAGGRIVRLATDEEVRDALLRFSTPFGELQAEIAAEQREWMQALARPYHDRQHVEAGLRAALSARELDGWALRPFKHARAAWDAWDAWDARDEWDACEARAEWDARAAWDAQVAWSARAAHARDAWVAWDAQDAWAARDALASWYAASRLWIDPAPDTLTIGIREAYAYGLDVAIPVDAGVLGYAMVAAPR